MDFQPHIIMFGYATDEARRAVDVDSEAHDKTPRPVSVHSVAENDNDTPQPIDKETPPFSHPRLEALLQLADDPAQKTAFRDEISKILMENFTLGSKNRQLTDDHEALTAAVHIAEIDRVSALETAIEIRGGILYVDETPELTPWTPWTLILSHKLNATMACLSWGRCNNSNNSSNKNGRQRGQHRCAHHRPWPPPHPSQPPRRHAPCPRASATQSHPRSAEGSPRLARSLPRWMTEVPAQSTLRRLAQSVCTAWPTAGS